MEKLEKALAKARLLRAKVLADEHPQRAADEKHAPLFRPSQDEQPLPGPTVGLDENILDHHRIVAHHASTEESDVIRLLRTQVLRDMAQNNFKTLGITSPSYGDGKTTIAINLAISMAMDVKQTVLLVDLDLRKPCLAQYLGLPPSLPGLTQYLSGKADLSSCLQRLPYERLVVLPVGSKILRSSEVLGQPRMAALADEMKNRYPDRLIIYDMPPLLAQDDPLAFMPNIDAALLILRDGVTKAEDIKRCFDILGNTHVIGTVLNSMTLT